MYQTPRLCDLNFTKEVNTSHVTLRSMAEIEPSGMICRGPLEVETLRLAVSDKIFKVIFYVTHSFV